MAAGVYPWRMVTEPAHELHVRPMGSSDLPWALILLGADADLGHYAIAPSQSGERWRAFAQVLTEAHRCGEIADETGHRHGFAGYVAEAGGSPCAVVLLRIDKAVEIFMFSVIVPLRHRGIGKRVLAQLLRMERYHGRSWVATCHRVSGDMTSLLLHRGFRLLTVSRLGASVLGRGIRRTACRV